jgi:hypothetical protein
LPHPVLRSKELQLQLFVAILLTSVWQAVLQYLTALQREQRISLACGTLHTLQQLEDSDASPEAAAAAAGEVKRPAAQLLLGLLALPGCCCTLTLSTSICFRNEFLWDRSICIQQTANTTRLQPRQ